MVAIYMIDKPLDVESHTFLTCCIVINSKGVGAAPVENAWHEGKAIK